MWDGSFKSSRQVSMRGKSAREESRNEVKERIKRDRERRRREKLEETAGLTLTRVGFSFLVRQEARRQAAANWTRHIHDLAEKSSKRLSSSSSRKLAKAVPELSRFLIFSYDKQRPDQSIDVDSMCYYCQWLVYAISKDELSDVRIPVLSAILLDVLQDALYGTLSHSTNRGGKFSKEDLISALASALTHLLEGDKFRALRTAFINPTQPSRRYSASIPSILRGLIKLDGIEKCVDELSLVQMLSVAVADFVANADEMEIGDSEMGDLEVETLKDTDVVMHDFACAVLCVEEAQLQALGMDEILLTRFSASAWAASLRRMGGLASSASKDSALILANVIRITRASAEDSPDRQDIRAVYWRAVRSMLSSTRSNAHILETVPELRQFRSPTKVTDELYAVLEPNPKLDLALAVCSAYEIIRRKWTTPPQGGGASSQGSARSLDVLSASGVVTGAVAFTSHKRSIVRMLWLLFVDFLYDNGEMNPEIFRNFSFDEVCSTLTFTCAVTCQLLPALDDEEIFIKGTPLSVDLLERIALFLKNVLYEGFWLQKGSTTSRFRDFPEELLTKGAELYDQLFERHCRHPIMDDARWLFPSIREDELGISAMPPSTREAPRNRAGRRRMPLQNGARAWFQQRSGLPRAEVLGHASGGTMDLDDGLENDESDSDAESGDSDSDEDGASAAKAGITPENASERVKQVLRTLPETVPFDQRTRVFSHYLSNDRRSVVSRRMHSNFTRITVHRGSVYQDALETLGGKGPFKGRIQVVFKNQQGLDERGIDGGGLFKEFMLDLMNEAFDLDNGLWKATANQEIYPNPDRACAAPEKLRQYEFIGVMLGKAIYEGILLELSLAPFFLNSILGRRNHLHDLQSLDPEIYRNVIHLKSLADPASVGLTFSTVSTRNGVSEEVDLIPNGSRIEVSKANYLQYVLRLSSYRLNEEFRPQTMAFLSGFTSMISEKWIQMFKPRELQLVIGGSDEGFSVAEMRAACAYSNGYHASQPFIQDFWAIVEEMDKEERGLLLRFITSCSKPPLQGFKSLKPSLCIGRVSIENDDDRLPTASTCVNFFKLPEYSSKAVLREKIFIAIKSASGFELS
ncbi:E3 ubiquitin-protein ligase UPL6 [Hondaea fermentalgiana]|uniref:HECT-type E3 ubiquitin transferase n=1 Tax=Hondaea fermentalgiana TaxID=2315210 RepID=A0A2R5G4G9_9STRA|nr:E3 ubiquitin-protein ligase UPL6 [Hondaea fermentalgiana]|eukprot:GBG24678.1 E3 ubiquitin-protein ligase UPL6 [Hondaea fermentalgiana]